MNQKDIHHIFSSHHVSTIQEDQCVDKTQRLTFELRA